MKNNEPKLFAGYVPVIHDGYKTAWDRHRESTIGIFNNEVLNEYGSYLRKDIRALQPEDAEKCINGMGRQTLIIGKKALLDALGEPIIMPSDDITRSIESANPSAQIIKESVFLRWDRDNSVTDSVVIPDRVVSINDGSPMMDILNEELSQSTNWWRHLGAVIFDNDGVQIQGHNSPVPTEHTSWIDGDPRITAKKGEVIERSIDIHAEASIISEAARKGIYLEGKSICVTTFPCPNCAKLIALSGIKTCYYVEGYSTLDGYDILKSFDVEVIRLDTKLKAEDPNIFKPYPSK